MKGTVFDIQKFSVHDGPGIRSTLFLKGCPLQCIWCHNPEGIGKQIRLWYFEKKCIRCAICIGSCPKGALSEQTMDQPFIAIDRKKCDNCGKCVTACPTESLAFDGYELTVEQVMEKLIQDTPFYQQSGGGITISGGDPLFQHRFSLEVLKRCRSEGIHTAIETSMQAPGELFQSFIGLVDLFIVDLKIDDPELHRKYTGADNHLIKSNFQLLAERKQDILVRIPLIPGITDREDNLRALARFVHENASQVPIELMNFNPLSPNKYRLMGLDSTALESMQPFNADEMNMFNRLLSEEGIQVLSETAVSE